MTYTYYAEDDVLVDEDERPLPHADISCWSEQSKIRTWDQMISMLCLFVMTNFNSKWKFAVFLDSYEEEVSRS